jgi:hypothetical protein
MSDKLDKLTDEVEAHLCTEPPELKAFLEKVRPRQPVRRAAIDDVQEGEVHNADALRETVEHIPDSDLSKIEPEEATEEVPMEGVADGDLPTPVIVDKK